MKLLSVRAMSAVGLTMILASATAPAFAVSPQTRALPADHGLFSLSCNEDVAGQLYSVDPTDAHETPVGTGAANANDDDFCAGAAAVDPDTGKSYYLDLSTPYALRSIDPSTGVSEEIGILTYNESPVRADGLAIGPDGAAYLISNSYASGVPAPFPFRVGDPDQSDTANRDVEASEYALFSVDLSTGELTLIGDIGSATGGWAGFSFDRSTGDLVVVDNTGLFFRLNPVTLDLDDVGQAMADSGSEFSGTDVIAMTIAPDGTVWLLNEAFVAESEGYRSELWSADLSDLGGSEQYAGILSTEPGQTSGQRFSISLFVAPVSGPAPVTPSEPAPAAVTPALAETGVDDAATTVLAGSAALALLAGAGALIATRARRNARA